MPYKYTKLMISAIILLTLFNTGCMNNNSVEKEKCVQSLSVHFEKEIDNFNATQNAKSFKNNGLGYRVNKGNYSEEIFMWVEWMIPKDEADKFSVNSLNVSIRGYIISDRKIATHLKVGGFPILTDDETRLKLQKELTKQAAYEIAEIIGVELDWDSHIYTISWMTMTSEGTYEEK